MEINDEMFKRLLRYHLEYETTRAKNKDIQNIFVMLQWLYDEHKKLKEEINGEKLN